MVISLALFENRTSSEVFGLIASTFLMANIPTGVLLGIYIGCREKKKRKKALERMSIQDLE